jgi:predicted ribosomally synthesized peptide with SipW-like signal peptide
MRKSIILAAVVVVALVIAGTGGVFATWSDSETSEGNWIETGSLDLKVNGADDVGRIGGQGVPRKVFIECMTPCNWRGPFEVELWNAGQCKDVPTAYIHFKEYECFNVPPKINPYDPDDPDSGGSYYWYKNWGPGATTGYMCPVTGDLKPEPELVAEFGGKVDCTWVDGIGFPLGDTCSMLAAVEVRIVDEAGTELLPEGTLLGDLYVLGSDGEPIGLEIELFPLPPCEARTLYLYFKLHQFAEEDFDFDFFPHPDDLGMTPGTPEYQATYMHWLKFNDWVSNAYMKDGIVFNIEFDLVLLHDLH